MSTMAWFASVSVLLATTAPAQPERLGRRERIVLFPTVASLTPDGSAWRLTIHGWIYEEELSDRELRVWETLLDLDDHIEDPRERARLRERLGPFLVDNERDREVTIDIGGIHFRMPPSESNGHFQGEVTVPAGHAARVQEAQGTPGRIRCRAVLRAGDDRVFEGTVFLVPETGISVISDIDDTLRLTGIGNNKIVFRTTFLEPLRAVPGMAEVYSGWERRHGAVFHYLSASPWQLFLMLDAFFRDEGFPGGSFHLKPVRLKDRSLFTLFAPPEEYKPRLIEGLLKRFPQRRFVLVGDGSERDPEIFAEIARGHPRRIVRVLIRDPKQQGENARYTEAFRGLPAEMCVVFRDPAAIRDALEHATATATAPP